MPKSRSQVQQRNLRGQQTDASLYILATAETAETRREDFRGQEHLVVPIVALVEGVIHPGNVAKPELALAEVFGAIPTSWNGRPVTLSHPERKGIKVSASQTPEVFEEEALGFLFNTKLDGTKLKTEAWINLSTVEDMGEEVKEEITRLESGELVEVSTGLFALVDPVEGKHNGSEYFGVWAHVVPDHLAILRKGEIGACSVKDGCGGPRVNHKNPSDCKCKGACTECKENSMPKTNSDPEKDMSDPTDSEAEQEDKAHPLAAFLTGLRDNFSGVFKLLGNTSLSDVDRRRAIMSALTEEDKQSYYEVVAVFEGSFVYAKNFDGDLLERSFSIADEGPITLGEEVTKVRPVTEFVPVRTKEDQMTTNETVDKLIANEATQFTEDDREWLSELPEDRLNKLAVHASAEPEKEEAGSEEEEASAGAQEDEPTANAATPEEFIASAPKEIQEVLQEGLRMQSAEKSELIKQLKDSKRCDFSDAQLKGMSIGDLRSLAKLADVPDYTGRAGQPRTQAAPVDDNKAPPAPKVFERNQNVNGG